MPIPATILVVDDQAYVRHTLRSLLAQQPHWKIHEAGDGKAAVESTRKLKPDVVVMDIVMPVMNGIAATYPPVCSRYQGCVNQQPLHAG